MQKKWFKLDTAALIFPATMSRKWSNAFRVSAELKEDIDSSVLQQAVFDLKERFPSFYVKLSSGFFWFRLEESRNIPKVSEDYAFPLVYLSRKELKKNCMRVLFYKKRIAVECFHSITDGNGGILFLKNLIRRYLFLKHGITCDNDEVFKNLSAEPNSEELEDSFFKYASEYASRERDPLAFKTKGSLFSSGRKTLITGSMPTEKLVEVAHGFNCSVTCFISAVMLWALIKLQDATVSVKKQKSVKITVPVNLRKLYGSKTLRNFALALNIGVDPRLGDYTIDNLCSVIKHQLKTKATTQFMSGMIAENTLPQKNIFLRLVPLFMKNIVMRFVYSYRGEKGGSINVSNLGMETLPESLSCFVDRIDFIIGAQKSYPNNCSVVSFNGTTRINVIREIKESELERLFFSKLVEFGIPVEIESNED